MNSLDAFSYWALSTMAAVSMAFAIVQAVMLFNNAKAQVSGERRLRSLIDLARINPYSQRLNWSEEFLTTITNEDEWAASYTSQLVHLAHIALSKKEEAAILRALYQPSHKGRLRYIEKLVGSSGSGRVQPGHAHV